MFLEFSEAAENPYGEDDNKSPFPVQPQVKRSYAQTVTVWIKASGLQVLRFSIEEKKKLSHIWRMGGWRHLWPPRENVWVSFFGINFF